MAWHLTVFTLAWYANTSVHTFTQHGVHANKGTHNSESDQKLIPLVTTAQVTQVSTAQRNCTTTMQHGTSGNCV
jgi:hypothetical protein